MNKTSGIVLCCVATLLALGAVMVYSVISSKASTLEIGTWYLMKHLLWVTTGVVAMLALSRVDYHRYERWVWPVAIAAGVLLVLVLAPGIGTLKNGARRWLRFGPVGFQPSEVAKIALIVVVAAMCARRGEKMREYSNMALCMAVVLVASALIVLEPDFGTAALVGGIGTLMVLTAGAPLLPVGVVGALATAGAATLIWHSPARADRVLAFLNPWTHDGRAAYQVQHSLIALGSGGITGRGLGGGQQKIFFLPEPDTDFIFAITGEELGLIGALVVLAVFVVLVRQGMKISARARDPFGALLAFGVTVMIAIQALMHVAVVTASMPTKGIALPFVSSGGSSIVISLIGIGILLSVSAQGREAEAPVTARTADAAPAGATGG
jgi:cell division protein FtsW